MNFKEALFSILTFPFKPNTWYCYVEGNVFFKYFMETEKDGMVDILIVRKSCKPIIARYNYKEIAELSPNDFKEYPNPKILDILYTNKKNGD